MKVLSLSRPVEHNENSFKMNSSILCLRAHEERKSLAVLRHLSVFAENIFRLFPRLTFVAKGEKGDHHQSMHERARGSYLMAKKEQLCSSASPTKTSASPCALS